VAIIGGLKAAQHAFSVCWWLKLKQSLGNLKWKIFQEKINVVCLGSWLLSAVTVEERRYGLMTTRLPDLT